MKLSLRLQLFAGFGILVLFIAAMGSVAYTSISRILESDVLVDHTTQVISNIREFDADLKRAQSNYRAYMLSQNPYYLKSAEASMRRVLPKALQTQMMTLDNPVQIDTFGKLVPLLKTRVSGSEKTLQLFKSGQIKEVIARFKSPDTIRVNDIIDKLISKSIVEEENLLTKRRDQEAVYAHTTLLVLVIGATAATLFAFGALLAISREVGKRAKTQELLQLNEYRLFQFLEAVPLGIFVMDKDGKPFYANHKARELLGHGVVQSHTSDHMATLDQAFLAGTDSPYPNDKLPMARALAGEKSSVEDLEIHHEDGRIIPLQVWGTPVVDMKGAVQYALAIFSDITERKHVEEMKQSLISVASHQLKTPVGEINGYIENLLDGLAGELTANQKDYLMDMREIGMNNYRLICDFLNLSKIERGLMNANIERFPIHTIVELGLRDYETIIDRKGLKLFMEGLDPDLFVLADMDKMVETLRNLISNSIKFTDKGGIAIKAEVDGQWVRLKVSDTGPGISDVAMKQMFSQKRILGEEAGRAGAGIGLYIVKNFMEAQGGKVQVDTQKGKGTTFTLSIPKAV